MRERVEEELERPALALCGHGSTVSPRTGRVSTARACPRGGHPDSGGAARRHTREETDTGEQSSSRCDGTALQACGGPRGRAVEGGPLAHVNADGMRTAGRVRVGRVGARDGADREGAARAAREAIARGEAAAAAGAGALEVAPAAALRGSRPRAGDPRRPASRWRSRSWSRPTASFPCLYASASVHRAWEIRLLARASRRVKG